MIIKLYNTKSTANTINKVLEDELELDITFKDTANILNPIIRLRAIENLDFNYCYIPDFDRYYFIRDIKNEANQIVILSLETDVLESWKEDILKSRVIVSRHKKANKYFDGGSYEQEVRKEVTLHESDKTPIFKENAILVTIGGA